MFDALRRRLRSGGAVEEAAEAQVQAPQPEPVPDQAPPQWNFEQFFEQYEIAPAITIEEMEHKKLQTICDIGAAASIRDYGGLWGVCGKYLLEGARALHASYAEMVDATPIVEFADRAKELEAEMPIRVEMRRGDFRNPRLYDGMEPVEVSVLYDVMLHQDNHTEVIKNVVKKTSRCVCLAQPVLSERLFSLPCGSVLLQFYPPELKDLIRNGWWPAEQVVNVFKPHIWMWGQTVSYFRSVFYGYGWGREYLEVCHLSPHWDYAFMRFVPREKARTTSPPASPSEMSLRDTPADLRAGRAIKMLADAAVCRHRQQNTIAPRSCLSNYAGLRPCENRGRLPAPASAGPGVR
jgi:hypothetical protein